MSIFSALSRGNGQDQRQQEQNAAAATTTNNNSSSTLLTDQQVEENAKKYYQTSPTTTTADAATSSLSAIDQMQGGVSEFLSQVDFSSSQLDPVVKNSGIEYLSIEDGPAFSGGVVPSRGWGDDLCYGTGTMYLMGLSSGGAWGFIEGMRSQYNKNFKLRLNSVLNSMTRRGPFVGNSLGILAMFYNSLNSAIGAHRGTRDQFNSLGAAAISGVLFKSASGPRASLISGIVCAGVVGTYHAIIAAYNSHQEKSLALEAPSEPQLSQQQQQQQPATL